MYDYLIVGTGLYGAVFARKMADIGKRCLVIDKRGHVGGNAYTETVEGIEVHKYGAHIFHTDNRYVWNYVNRFAEFNRYTNSPLANYKDHIYNLPFNMNTFYRLWGVTRPEEAKEIIDGQRCGITDPKNLEEQAVSLVGTDIYEKLIKDYSEKQWGRKCKDLPAFIIKRLPIRFTFDNNYFSDRYQGIPISGYTTMIQNMLRGIEISLNTAFTKGDIPAKKVIYTGMIDEYYDYCYGPLEYRSLAFEIEILDMPNYQGNAVVNYTDAETPYTRIIEHKHFVFGEQEKTVITREYPKEWKPGGEPYYPMNDDKNSKCYSQYKLLAENEKDVLFGGRLGSYKYYDMWQVVADALDAAEKESSS